MKKNPRSKKTYNTMIDRERRGEGEPMDVVSSTEATGLFPATPLHDAGEGKKATKGHRGE